MNTNQRRLEKYELQERLAHGSITEVWKALDSQSKRYVAVKLLNTDLRVDPDFLKRFAREVPLVAALQHPNIVKIHDFQIARPSESNSPFAYIVMDYIEGPTLADYIGSTSHIRRFPAPDDIVHLFTYIGMAVDYAHRHEMIHRDLKPANILLDKRNTIHNPIGEPILTDFGLAQLLGNSGNTPSSTRIGNALYTSPEQAMGSPGNECSDIYSLGVILYEICTGSLPFKGNTMQAILQQHIKAMPPSPALLNPGIRPALTMVILRCLAKDPAARFPNCASLTAAVAQAFNLPVPTHLDLTPYSLDPANEPTYFKPLHSEVPHTSSYEEPIGAPPSSSAAASQPLLPQEFSSPNLAVGVSVPPYDVTPSDAQSGPATPRIGISGPTSSANPVHTPPILTTPPTSLHSISSPPTRQRRRRRNLIIALLILLVIFANLGVGAFFLFSHQRPVITASQVVGQAYFLSSGQVGKDGILGIDDELLVDLHNLSNPSPGKSYYTWLLSDTSQSDWRPVLLGPLPVTRGVAHSLYTNPQHTNLLGLASRFLITEEDANINPTNPSPTAWHYYAEIPLNIVAHMRYLLVNDPMIKEGGGLDTRLFRNTQQVFEWAGSARSYWMSKSTGLMRAQFIRILEYLKGPSAIGTDLPFNIQLPTQPPSVALLGSATASQDSPDFLHAIGGHVTAMAQASDSTSNIRTRANYINVAINNITSSLERVYQDTKALYPMTNQELLQPQALALLNDLDSQAFYAYVGQLDPTTNQVEPGVVQLHNNIQLLATFDITLYKS